jgi:hypothetical protein
VSQTSHDARAVVRAIDALTEEVRRLADAQPTGTDGPSTTADDGLRCVQCGSPDVRYRNYREQPFCWPCANGEQQAPAVGEDAQHTARRRDAVLNLLNRLDRHGTLTPEERALLRNHVIDEGLEHDTARADLARYEEVQGDMNERAIDLTRRAELADAVTAETKRLLERRTTTLRERAERAEATIERVRAARERMAHAKADEVDAIWCLDLVDAALDGAEQPTTEA